MTLATVVLLLVAAAAPQGDVVARVDGIAITRADVLERMRVLSQRRVATTASGAANVLVDEALLAAEARRQGLDRDPVLLEKIAGERRRLILAALEEDLQSTAKPSEDTLRRMYHSTGDVVRLSLVKLVSRQEAEAALARVKAGGDLAAEARRSVDAALVKSGGDTGLVSRGQLDPALADAAFAAETGALFGPVELKLGWAMGRVVERTVADEAAFPSRRAALESFVRRQLAAEALRHLKDRLAARAAVSIDEAFLRGLGHRTNPTPKELEHVIATVNGAAVRYAAIHEALSYIASAGGHGAGPETKLSLARKAVDDRLLEVAAVERGLASSPAVSAVFPGIERYLLANALASRVAAGPGRSPADAKVRAKVAELRPRARVDLDEASLSSLSSR